MKKLTLLFLSPLLLLTVLLLTRPSWLLAAPAGHVLPAQAPLPAAHELAPPAPAPDQAEELVDYALSLQGSPYVYAGITPDGFDCSGFVTHVFGHFGLEVPHSSALQAEVGEPVARQQARPGDLVIFTGTNPDVREPGHVGIILSEPGDTLTFVHASSNGGVKVSQVEGTRYSLRFLELRRVL